MRLDKVSSLIHNSTKVPRTASSRVEVHFAKIIDSTTDEEAFAIVAGSELVVSREARKDNSSSYRVDEKVKQYKEVAALLRTRGIDLDHNRFLILQGEVEQIAMMKPKRAASPHPPQAPTEDEGLLEYLEDIIGSNRHVDPIEEKAKALETLNEQRGGQVNRAEGVEKERDALSGAKAEAERSSPRRRSSREEVAAATRGAARTRAGAERGAAEERGPAFAAGEGEGQGTTPHCGEAIETLEAQHAKHAAALAALRADLAAARQGVPDFEKRGHQAPRGT